MGIHWSSIRWEHLILTHFACAMLVIAVILFILSWLLQKIRHQHSHNLLLRWLLLLPVGVTGIYLFVMHLLFPIESASIMKWPSSQFQYEVALANLCLGVLGILSFRGSYGFQLATVIAVTLWMWGHAIYEIYHIIVTSNIYLGNAVSWFWLYLLLPFVLIICIKRPKQLPMVVEPVVIEPHHEV